jgi:predicted transposase YbfD/YdcC
MTNSIFIRDTLVTVADYEAMNDDKKAALNDLISQYRKINYIDVRTQLGPDQIRRMSHRQYKSISDNMLKVFAIETKVKQLLKTDIELEAEANKQAAKNRQDRINRIQYRIRDIETYLTRKLSSNRENPTKKEYRELKEELAKLIK